MTEYIDGEEMDEEVRRFLQNEIPSDPNQVRMSLQFSKDIIANLQSDIHDLQTRLNIAEETWQNDDENNDINNDDDSDNESMNELKKKYGNINDKKNKHEKFFSTYNLLSKQVYTADTLINSMGTYNALLTYNNNTKTFENIVDGLLLKLKNEQDTYETISQSIKETFFDIDDDFDETNNNKKKLFKNHIKNLLDNSKNVVDTIQYCINELQGTKSLIHPDQRKISELEARIKELEHSLPYGNMKKLAVINLLPTFVREELAEFNKRQGRNENQQKKKLQIEPRKRGKKSITLVDDNINDIFDESKNNDNDDDIKSNIDYNSDIINEEELNLERERIDNFNFEYESMKQNGRQIVEDIDTIKNGELYTMKTRLDDEDVSNALSNINGDNVGDILQDLIDNMDKTLNKIETMTIDLDKSARNCNKYIHPSQNSLIKACKAYMNECIHNDSLRKQIAKMNGELLAANDALAIRNENNDKKNKYKNNKLNIPNINNSHDSSSEEAQELIPNLIKKIDKIKSDLITVKTTLTPESAADNPNASQQGLDRQSMINVSYKVETIEESISELGKYIVGLKDLITPDTEYIIKLEKRYQVIKGLYKLKYYELEQSKEANIYYQNQLKEHKNVINELEVRLQRIMTSAASSHETRLEALKTMGVKGQTYNSVMKLIDDIILSTDNNLHEIDNILQKDIKNIIIQNGDDIDLDDFKKYSNHLNKKCEIINKNMKNLKEEMTGVSNFIHPDRVMVQQLQQEVIEMTLQMKVMQQTENYNKIDIDTEQALLEASQTKRKKSIELENENRDDDETMLDDDDDYDDNIRDGDPETGNDNNNIVSSNGKRVMINAPDNAIIDDEYIGVSNGGAKTIYNDPKGRTKSVHEIAWSKFDIDEEKDFEQLQKKEAEVLREQIKQELITKLSKEYNDKYEMNISKIKSELRKEIRAEIENEIAEQHEQTFINDDELHELMNNNNHNDNDIHNDNSIKNNETPKQPPTATILGIDQANIKNEIENEYKAETQKMIHNYTNEITQLNDKLNSKQQTVNDLRKEVNKLNGTINELKENIQDMQENMVINNSNTDIGGYEDINLNDDYNDNEVLMQMYKDQISQLEIQINDLIKSKISLAEQTSEQINSLRNKIFNYTKGNYTDI